MPHERTISPATYIVVCVILVLLTVLTVGVSFLPVHGVWHIVFGLAIALCKASLVVLFFMHALLSTRHLERHCRRLLLARPAPRADVFRLCHARNDPAHAGALTTSPRAASLLTPSQRRGSDSPSPSAPG